MKSTINAIIYFVSAAQEIILYTFLQLVSFLCSAQSLSVTKVCIVFATTSAMHSSVLLSATLFGFSSGSVHISSVFNLEMAFGRMFSVSLDKSHIII